MNEGLVQHFVRDEGLARGEAQEAQASAGRKRGRGKDLRGRVMVDVAGDVVRRCRVERMDQRRGRTRRRLGVNSGRQSRQNAACNAVKRGGGQHLRFTAMERIHYSVREGSGYALSLGMTSSSSTRQRASKEREAEGG